MNCSADDGEDSIVSNSIPTLQLPSSLSELAELDPIVSDVVKHVMDNNAVVSVPSGPFGPFRKGFIAGKIMRHFLAKSAANRKTARPFAVYLVDAIHLVQQVCI